MARVMTLTFVLRLFFICLVFVSNLKAGVHMKAVFWLGSMFFMQISR